MKNRNSKHLVVLALVLAALTTASRWAAELRRVSAQASMQPLALVSGDFDEDGVPDLISGYAGSGKGILTVRRGNVDALFPTSPAAQQKRARGQLDDSPFLSAARTLSLPDPPEFIAAGDFNADGHLDLVTAARGSNQLCLLPGNGRGGFGQAQLIELPGRVTAMASGEVNQADGLNDLVVGVNGGSGPQAMVFESPDGALRAKPEAFALPAEATALAVGRLDGDQLGDLAIAAGHNLIVASGRDRKLSLDPSLQAEVKPAAISQRAFPAAITSIIIGDLTGDQRPSLAVLSDDGAVQMLGDGGQGSELGEWPAREALRVSPAGSQLVCARISAHAGQDLVVVDSSRRQLRVVTGGAERADAALKFEGEPVAALPMQLNGDALSDLVVLSSGQTTFVMTAPAATFPVTNASDSGPGSLRNAITQANTTAGADMISFAIGSGLQTINLLSPLPAITEAVTIDGTTQPGFAGAPLIVVNGSSAGVTTNGLIINAANCTIKGLVINGFGHVGIVINGAGATGNKVEGCYIGVNAAGTAAAPNGTDPNSFDIDGVDILNGAHDNTIGGTAAARNIISGNRGDGVFIAFGGSNNNLIQGNYIGLNAAGVAAIPNGLAIGAFGVELATDTGLGPQGNIIGGTTPGAGNVISGNPGAGVGIFNANTNNNLVQGNFIGTNAAGAGAVPNFQGVAIANPPGGPTSAKNNLIGGTVVSARNIISGNSFDGVFIAHAGTTNNLVQGNYIGTNPAGAAALPNVGRGVEIAFGAQANTVGGTTAGARNLLSGNSNDGAAIFNPETKGNFVQGNYIGTDAAGAVAVPNGVVNGFHGVEIAFGASGNTVGGTAAGSSNLISGNAGFGVGIFNPGTNSNNVQGNLIGLNAAGSAALPPLPPLPGGSQANSNAGASMDASQVLVQHKTGGVMQLNSNEQNSLARSAPNNASSPAAIGNFSGVAIVSGAQNNLIGGTTAGARNVISGNGTDGVFLRDSGTTGNQVLGNFIGTDLTGTLSAPNLAGIEVAFGAQSNAIGGIAGAGNLISGNGQFGVLIANSGTRFNTVVGNLIGTKADGVSGLGNGSHGVFFSFSTDNNNIIGGPSGAASNIIAFNGGAGIFADSGLANPFRRNSIFSNGGLGIDLAPLGVTPNDNCDVDSGPNNLQNFPVLTAATSIPGSTTIQGTLNSTASTTFTVEFFANPACDASGNGEGKTFVGSTSVTTAANCIASFNVTVPTSVPVGQFITATATDPTGNTSEFSACLQVTAGCFFSIAPTTQTFTAATSSSTVAVTAPGGCSWTAVSNDSFITVTSGSSGVGNGTVNYSVAANPSANPRTGTMTIAGKTFTVNQSGMTCAGIISPTNAAFPAGGGTNSVSVPAPTGCSWTATSNDAFITITSGTPGSGAGTVNYSVASNPGSARTGTMTIAGQTFTVTEAGSGLQYYPLARPIRLLDTRPGESACDAPGAPLTGGADRSELARVTCDGLTIPANAAAIVGNATVVNFISGPGFITLYPSGAARPTVSNLNYLSNQIVPNAFTVGLGSDGKFNIFATTSTHFIVDITGYYAPPGAGGHFYHPLPRPIRLLDTRPGAPGCDTPGSPLTGGADRTEIAFVSCDGITIPAEAQAVVGNATVVNFVSGPGFITLYPSGAARPTVSNLNYVANQIIPNAFTVGLGSDGAFNIFATSSTDFIADITGYFSPQATDANGPGLLYYPLAHPIRLLDTRPGEPACDAPSSPLIGGATRSEAARVTCDGITIPANAAAIVGNATVVNFLSGGGFITLYPSDAAQPTVSNLNYLSNQVVPNAFTVGLGGDGKFNIFASTSTHFITDLTGFYAP